MNLKSEGRIYLRPITIEDTDNVLRWRNGENVKPFFIYQEDITKEMHYNWLETKVKTGKVVQFIIVEEETDRGIGSVYIQDVDYNHKKAEYGIFIGEDNCSGKGYGTIAAKLMVQYAFEELKLHRVYLRVYEENKRAISSYEKAGFKQEALLRDDVYVNGVYRNVVLMGIINEGK